MSRRRRSQFGLLIQYLVAIAILGAVAVKANWPALLNAFLDPTVVPKLFPDAIVIALKNTAIYSLCGFCAGVALGLIAALMSLSPVPIYRWVALVYVEIFRGLPATVVFIAFGYGIPLAFDTSFPGGMLGTVTGALAVVGGAYMAETFRAGIEAVPTGQTEAARSLGMTSSRAMISIVLPQAVRIMVPPMTNLLVIVIKDSSLVYLLGLTFAAQDLLTFGRQELNAYASMTPIVIAGLCYLIITIPLSALARRLETRNA